MMQPPLLFTVSNHHAESSGKPPSVDGDIRKRYHGYFENGYGEQCVFVYDYEVGEGTLWMGDAGWGRTHPVVDGDVPELLMDEHEKAWLMACWKAAMVRKGM
ncbi:MAG: hypothetical protein IT320_05275 [Anaerolineae bacterium]|nr:hypothetical protein [Anaerolineae bacterium]